MTEVGHTLLKGHRKDSVELIPKVMVGMGNVASLIYSHFDLVTYWDPLITFSQEYAAIAAFTL